VQAQNQNKKRTKEKFRGELVETTFERRRGASKINITYKGSARKEN
jgi:hypothetical protein